MKRGKAHLPPCTLLLSSAAFVQGYQRSSFGLLVTGSISPFVKVMVHSFLELLLLTQNHLWLTKSGASPLEFLALLLFALPLVFTLQKLLLLL